MPYSFTNADPCSCIRCAACGGSGQVRVGDPIMGYDLESCDECSGSGITETCDRCRFLMEAEHV